MTDSFTSALERLDPASRALLDLSLRRGMRTEEIAEILGAEPGSVAASRDEALRKVAADVGMDASEQHLDEVRTRLAELPAEQWLGGAAPAGNGVAPDPQPDPEPVAVAEPEPEPAKPSAPATSPLVAGKRRRPNRVLPVLLGLLLLVGVIVAIVLASGGDDDSASTSADTDGVQQAPANEPKPEGGKELVAVGAAAGEASGTARISDGNRLELEVTGLSEPRGRDYTLWLYNSVIDARPLGNYRSADIKFDGKLPGDWKRYRFIDVSAEPRDGNRSHSGESVMRVRTKSLAEG